MTIDLLFPNWKDFVKEYQQEFNKEPKKPEKVKFNGMHCKSCNIFNEYISEPNQDDGTYVCYECRNKL